MKTRIRMEITGDRKQAMGLVAGILNTEARYLGMPTGAYEAGGWSIDRHMTLASPVIDSGDTHTLRQVLDVLVQADYTAIGQMKIDILPDRMDVSNLEKIQSLLGSKASLIQKAFGTEEALMICTFAEGFVFGVYSASLAYTDVLTAIQFSCCVHDQAVSQKRITGKDKPLANERYAFRNFLNRLGCIGPEYKLLRKTLCKRLSGNSAFKSGAPSQTNGASAESKGESNE